MEELKKVHRVIAKTMEGAPHRVYLVLDATTGQNAIQQAKNFKEAVAVNGVILTKLDSSAKGGVVFSIVEDLQLPIVYVGLGEKEEDLISFDPESFINSLIN
jgi:fused signal recognition particle receptor